MGTVVLLSPLGICKDVATTWRFGGLAELHCGDSCLDLWDLRFHKCSLYADAMWWWVVGGAVVRYIFITLLLNMFKV